MANWHRRSLSVASVSEAVLTAAFTRYFPSSHLYRKKQKVFEVKEVKLRPGIEDHDFGVKFKNAARFLEDGNKVKVTIMFRGREMSHPELGEALLIRMAEELGNAAIVEKKPKLEGRNMTMIVAPKSK